MWCQLIVRIKAIKSIKKLLYFSSSYINLQFSDLCSKQWWQRLVWLHVVIVDCYKIRLVIICLVIDLAIELAIITRYCYYRSDFYKSD